MSKKQDEMKAGLKASLVRGGSKHELKRTEKVMTHFQPEITIPEVPPDKNVKVSEKQVEARLCEKVKALGCESLKFQSPYVTGWPDRFVLTPWGELILVELKAPGKKPTKQQEAIHEKARKMRFPVFVLDSYGTVDSFVDYLASLKKLSGC